MEIVATEWPEVFELRPVRHGDDRGWFREVFRRDVLIEEPIATDFVQDNESFSAPVATLRGIHYQLAPFVQAKLVRVVAGAIRDVVVDLRRSSATFGRYLIFDVTAEAGNQVFVPGGFGHGFVTTTPDTQVCYKVSAPYSPDDERSVRWDDPELNIDWGLAGATPVLSPRDAAAPLLSEQPDLFD